MVLLEIAVQGVRGCSASARVALKPGYLVIKAPQPAVPPLASLVASIFYPDSRGGDAGFLAPGLKTGRAGVSLLGKDGSTFRLVRELGGAGALHKLNPTTKAFEVVTQKADEIVSSLRAQAGLPTRSTFEQLYTLTAAQLPSKRPRKAALAPKTKESPSEGRINQAFSEYENLSPDDVKEYEARIPILEKELKDAKGLAEVQFRQDGLQSELYNLENQLKGYHEAQAAVRAAHKELETVPTPSKLGLPDDIVEQLRRHEADIKKRDDLLKKMLEERDGTHVLDTGPAQVDPLYKDNNFLAAAVAGAALTVAGVVVEGPSKYIAMVAVPAWSFAAYRALHFLDALQLATRESGRFEMHSAREKKLMDERAASKAQMVAAFAKVHVDTMEEFMGVLGRREGLQATLSQAEAALAEIEGQAEVVSIEAKAAGLRAELEKIQAQFQTAAGGYFRGPGEIEKELQKIKENVRRAKGGAPAPAPVAAAAASASGGTLEDPAPALLAAAAEMLQADLARAALELKDRCNQYLTALSDKKWQGVEFGADGKATLVGPVARVAASEATPRDADLFYLSLRLTAAEKLGQKVKLPLLIEDCFGEAIDPARFSILNRMLKHLGSVVQVLHVSGSGQNAFQADALVSV